MLVVTPQLVIRDDEMDFEATSDGGPGGQHTHKVESAVLLKFDIPNSSLPGDIKQRMIKLGYSGMTPEGVIQIKSQSTRNRKKNKALAMERLKALILKAAEVEEKHQPKQALQKTRFVKKKQSGKAKRMRTRDWLEDGDYDE